VRDDEEPPPPPGAAYGPVPDIKANGQDRSVTLSAGASASITLNLNPGDQAGKNAEWWVAAHTPFGWFSYVHPAGWEAGIVRTFQGALFEILSPVELLNLALPPGDYTFYFALDDTVDGTPNLTWYDAVNVRVE